MAETTAGAVGQSGARVGYFRWVVCALLFLGTTINYIDRQVLGLLAPDLRRIIGWNDVEYGYMVTAFSAAYALGLLLSGRLLDDRLNVAAGGDWLDQPYRDRDFDLASVLANYNTDALGS